MRSFARSRGSSIRMNILSLVFFFASLYSTIGLKAMKEKNQHRINLLGESLQRCRWGQQERRSVEDEVETMHFRKRKQTNSMARKKKQRRQKQSFGCDMLK